MDGMCLLLCRWPALYTEVWLNTERAYTLVAATCHQHFHHNDQGLSRAIVVTLGGSDTERKSAWKRQLGRSKLSWWGRNLWPANPESVLYHWVVCRASQVKYCEGQDCQAGEIGPHGPLAAFCVSDTWRKCECSQQKVEWQKTNKQAAHEHWGFRDLRRMFITLCRLHIVRYVLYFWVIHVHKHTQTFTHTHMHI